MKYIKQCAIIGSISFLGELLHIVIHLPVPSSVYGLVILLICLFSGFIKVKHIEETAEFLIMIMPVMFISPSVGIITQIGGIKGSLPGIFIVSIISTFVVMIVTGLVSQFVMERKQRRNERNE